MKLKDNISTAGAGSAFALLNGEPNDIFTEALSGFSAKLDEKTLQALRRHPDVSRCSSLVSVLYLIMLSTG